VLFRQFIAFFVVFTLEQQYVAGRAVLRVRRAWSGADEAEGVSDRRSSPASGRHMELWCDAFHGTRLLVMKVAMAASM
jgi:hypothetical protein